MKPPAVTQEQIEARVREAEDQRCEREMTTVAIAAGAAAKAMQNAGWSKSQMLEMMAVAWETMGE